MRSTISLPRRLTPCRTVREEIAVLVRLGFEYRGTFGGHHRFAHPEYGELRPLSSTPRNERAWRVRHRSEVAALMGVSSWQLARLIAGQPAARSTPKRKRRATAAPRRRVRRATAIAAAPVARPVTTGPELAAGTVEAFRAGCTCPLIPGGQGVSLEDLARTVEQRATCCPLHEEERPAPRRASASDHIDLIRRST